jgi:carbamoyl-phosphate synthase large subunit
VNSNPATIMTDPVMADSTYIEPITWQTVARIIEKERPDAVLPTMGGQTALNCALDLDKHGVLEKFGCELIGASKDAIRMAEDRKLFDQAMRRIGLECPRAGIAHSMEEAFAVLEKVGFPGHHSSVLHHGRLRRRYRLQPRRIRGNLRARFGPVAHA